MRSDVEDLEIVIDSRFFVELVTLGARLIAFETDEITTTLLSDGDSIHFRAPRRDSRSM